MQKPGYCKTHIHMQLAAYQISAQPPTILQSQDWNIWNFDIYVLCEDWLFCDKAVFSPLLW